MRPNGQPMRGGEFRDGRWNEVIYDGTQFLLINTQGLSMVDGTSLIDNETSVLFWGFGGCCGGAAQIVRQTTPNVGTTAIRIASLSYGSLAIVVGNSGSNVFQDLILAGFGAANPVVVASMTASGGPVPSRTYTTLNQGDIRLQLSGGFPQYDVAVTALVGPIDSASGDDGRCRHQPTEDAI